MYKVHNKLDFFDFKRRMEQGNFIDFTIHYIIC